MHLGDALGNTVFTFDRNHCSRSPEYAIGAYYIWERASIAKANIRFALGSKVPLSLEESVQIRRDMKLKEEEFRTVIDGYKEKLENHSQIEEELRIKLQESTNKLKSQPVQSDSEYDYNFTEQTNVQEIVKRCDDFVLKHIEEMEVGEEATFKEMLPSEIWAKIPRRLWKNVNDTFLALVKNGVFPEIKHTKTREHNEPVYARIT